MLLHGNPSHCVSCGASSTHAGVVARKQFWKAPQLLSRLVSWPSGPRFQDLLPGCWREDIYLSRCNRDWLASKLSTSKPISLSISSPSPLVRRQTTPAIPTTQATNSVAGVQPSWARTPLTIKHLSVTNNEKLHISTWSATQQLFRYAYRQASLIGYPTIRLLHQCELLLLFLLLCQQNFYIAFLILAKLNALFYLLSYVLTSNSWVYRFKIFLA